MPSRQRDETMGQGVQRRMQGTLGDTFQRFHQLFGGNHYVGAMQIRRMYGNGLSGPQAYLFRPGLNRVGKSQRGGPQPLRQGTDGLFVKHM
jgi:hypothetical protein